MCVGGGGTGVEELFEALALECRCEGEGEAIQWGEEGRGAFSGVVSEDQVGQGQSLERAAGHCRRKCCFLKPSCPCSLHGGRAPSFPHTPPDPTLSHLPNQVAAQPEEAIELYMAADRPRQALAILNQQLSSAMDRVVEEAVSGMDTTGAGEEGEKGEMGQPYRVTCALRAP